MAMNLLDGFDANISFKTQRYASGSLTGTAVEHACWANTLSMEFRQDILPISKIVFCSVPGWKKKSPGERDAVATISGFVSKGDAASTPGTFHDGGKISITAVFDDPTPTTAGADVCSITGDFLANSDLLSVVAKGNSNRVFTAESTGAISVAWVNT